MITLRAQQTRGRILQPFIDTRRTFSFPGYWNPRYDHYSDLETINDDRVQYSWSVPWHRHENMEIFGYVVTGSSHHVDSLGTDIEVPAGSVQRMSSGTGIEHTEGNRHSLPNRYLQLWIRPSVEGGEPCHDVYTFRQGDRDDRFFDITSVLPIRQAARLWTGRFSRGYSWPLDPSRWYYAYIVLGSAVINGIAVTEGDGLSYQEERQLAIESPKDLEIIVFDLRAADK